MNLIQIDNYGRSLYNILYGRRKIEMYKLKLKKGLKNPRRFGKILVSFKRLLKYDPATEVSGTVQESSGSTAPVSLTTRNALHQLQADKARALQNLERARKLF